MPTWTVWRVSDTKNASAELSSKQILGGGHGLGHTETLARLAVLVGGVLLGFKGSSQPRPC
jgi:hypothetical protein